MKTRAVPSSLVTALLVVGTLRSSLSRAPAVKEMPAARVEEPRESGGPRKLTSGTTEAYACRADHYPECKYVTCLTHYRVADGDRSASSSDPVGSNRHFHNLGGDKR